MKIEHALHQAAGNALAAAGQSLQHITREHLETVLEKTGWDLEKTALLLQIPLARVRQKIEKLGLAPEGPGPRAFSHPQDEATKEANDETPQS
jgi:DNA-binding NtrC family response regulator